MNSFVQRVGEDANPLNLSSSQIIAFLFAVVAAASAQYYSAYSTLGGYGYGGYAAPLTYGGGYYGGAYASPYYGGYGGYGYYKK